MVVGIWQMAYGKWHSAVEEIPASIAPSFMSVTLASATLT
jgi:hypothetical protein